MVPLLFAPELEGRTGLMFGHKAQPIKPTQGLDSAYIHRYLSASDALLRRALSGPQGETPNSKPSTPG
jgi:hypothetical protein